MGSPCRYTTWFTSDLHFGHASIIRYQEGRRIACGVTMEDLERDKEGTVKKHDDWLIDLWNSTIKRGDFVYILGDFSLGTKEYTEKILNKLHGRKYLILGNHDKSCKGLERYFEWVGDIKEVKFTHDQYPFIDPNENFCCELCHYPLLTWNRRTHGSCMVHGHCHNSITDFNTESGELRLDVGLDTDIANRGIVPLEKVYEHFRNIILSSGCTTFNEYNEKLMEKQGYRA